ncbi:MAG: hypothetical protein SPE06_02940 [[Actinobacillus] rossii]|nr:hypothetical protein [[Actinobacillus] rossii]MDY4505361.1 hypothetical protein [[Actinobacillus] rossii]
MATQTTPFQGTKFYIGIGLNTEKAITACTVTPNATITATGHGAKVGDFVKVSGLGPLDGYYPVKSVQTDTLTFADEVDWSEQDKPTDFSTAKMAVVKWSSNFCAIKKIAGAGDTLDEEDITTMCSDGTETEAGEITYSTIQLTFFYAPATAMQSDLRKKFYAKATFPWMMALKNKQGSLYGTGFIQTGPNWDGEVKGKFDSGVTIKKSKRDYHLPVAE